MTQLALDGIGPAPVQEILERFEARHGSYLEGARDVLAEEARHGEVTSDDFWRLVREGRIPPIPDGVSHNVLGALFRDDRFRPTDSFVRSERPEARGNLLRVWTRAA